MPAYNAARFIGQAVGSVLGQQGVTLELIVVDDGCSDGTAAIVRSFRDERIRLVRNERRRGIGACHNQALRLARAPHLAHVDADDFLLPGALRKMVDALSADPRAGQVHCYFFDVDANGRTTRAAVHQRWASFRRDRPPDLSYRERLQKTSGVINHLRTYRRSVLEELGGFDENLFFAIDYDMALRILERWEIRLVPEFLYVRRVHDTNTTESLRLKTFRFWLQKYRIRRRLVRRGRISFLPRAGFGPLSFLAWRARSRYERCKAAVRDAAGRACTRLRWRICEPVCVTAYRLASRFLWWWPIRLRTPRRAHGPAAGERLAYFLAAFPVLSETFIQREIAALAAERPVTILAQRAQEREHLDDLGRSLLQRTRYLEDLDGARLAPYVFRFLLRRPAALAGVLLFVIGRRHSEQKSLANDLRLLRQTVQLAGALDDLAIARVHTPWAGKEALVAMLAARLAGASFTLQARAYDIYKHSSAHALREKLEQAEIVITNARANASALRSLLDGAGGKVRTIYEGVDLEQLRPERRSRASGGPLRILAVGRLVEQKGFDELLRACRVLKDRGCVFSCEIVGSRSEGRMNHYLDLRKLQRRLDLEREVAFSGALSFDRVVDKYACSDIFVLPAVLARDGTRDVTPNALIEAMAMGLPVVSTTVGAIAEIVEHETSGLLVPSRDAAALADAIQRLIGDPGLRSLLGAQARRRVEERFDLATNIQSYAELFFPGAAPLARIRSSKARSPSASSSS